MSEDMQLVVLGGAIAIVSSVVTTILASLLGYWLEARHERRRLKLDLIQVIGRTATYLEKLGGDETDGTSETALFEMIAGKGQTPEDLAMGLGVFEAWYEIAKGFDELKKSETAKTNHER